MEISARQFARSIFRVVCAVATVCVLAVPASAAVDADFNEDGVLDHVVIPRSSGTHIVVRVSGGTPQVLKLSRSFDRIIAIVASDVNHDGHIDLSAVSERRGLFIWVNKGKAANGRLKAVKRKHRPVGFALTHGGPEASKSSRGFEGSGPASTFDDRDRLAQSRADSPVRSEWPGLATLTAFFTAPFDRASGPFASRAPPSNGH